MRREFSFAIRQNHYGTASSQDAANTPRVEVAEIRLLARLAFQQSAGDQKTAQHEEHCQQLKVPPILGKIN
jgi:hypothetical protein